MRVSSEYSNRPEPQNKLKVRKNDFFQNQNYHWRYDTADGKYAQRDRIPQSINAKLPQGCSDRH